MHLVAVDVQKLRVYQVLRHIFLWEKHTLEGIVTKTSPYLNHLTD